MYTISKEFAFSASHQLSHLAAAQPDHQCARLHGHNYVVVMVLASETLNDDGFVQDYGDLVEVKAYIDDALDHRHLNDVLLSPDGRHTTAERLAAHLFHLFMPRYPMLKAVRVSETPKTWAEYTP